MFDLIRCQDCSIVRTEPLLSENKLNIYYKMEYYGSESRKFRSIFEHFVNLTTYFRARTIYSNINVNNTISSNRVLDIGCGRGTLIKLLSKYGCDCYGVERSGFVFPNIHENVIFYNKDLKMIKFDPEMFDVVIMWHSLEHMSNPVETIEEITRILKPNGLLVLATPNFESFQSRLFRSKWFHLDLPRHTHHFGYDTLKKYIESKGFYVYSLKTNSIEQNPFGFLQSFFNFIPFIPINRMYSLFKYQKHSDVSIELLLWIALSCFILPMAIIEYLVSGIFGSGATLCLYAYKE